MLDDMTDSKLLKSIALMERRYTPKGLKDNGIYKSYVREAVKRGLRAENLTEQEQLIRVDLEGPSLDRQG